MRNDRTDYDLYVEFTHPETGETLKEWIYIPFEIYVEAIRQYCSRFKEVELDGTDNHIWNLFVDLDALDRFADDEEFNEICKELYEGSAFQEEDFEEWKDSYDYSHDIGEYAPKDED